MEHVDFQKFLAWSGVVCVALFFVAFVAADFIPPLSPNTRRASSLAFTRPTRLGSGSAAV